MAGWPFTAARLSGCCWFVWRMLKGRRALKWSLVERLLFLEHDGEEAGR
jgi:hypothetical protein